MTAKKTPATIENLLPIDPMVSMIERIAMDPDSDLEKLERMLEMKERHDANQAKGLYAAAFATASANIPSIPLNGRGHNNLQYAKLKDIMSYTRGPLAEQGLALTFAIDTSEKIKVTAKLMHKGGHFEETSIMLPSETSGSKNAVQAIGSAQTYGQRYTAQAILGLSLGEDTEDDGAATGKASRQPDQWTHAILSELPPAATDREKATAIAQALCAQFRRMKGVKQLGFEWDRRVHLIEGDKGLEGKHPDLHETVCDAYELRNEELTPKDSSE